MTGAILAGLITIGVLTENDSGGKSNDRQAAAAEPIASSLPGADGHHEEIATPSNSSATPTPVFYPSCAAVVAAGAAPLGQADRGFRAALDRDGDGRACELNGDDNPRPATTAATDDDDDPETEEDDHGGLDPRFSTCAKANDAGYGPYHRGEDPEYSWYRDRDKDGTVCEQ